MQGVASGTLLAGFGMSSFIAGKLFAAFAPADGSRLWATGLRILAVLALVVLALGIIVMRTPREGEAAAAAGGSGRGASSKKKAGREPASDIPTTEMVRKSTFWLFYVWIALLTASGLMLVSQASGIAAEVGTTLSGNTIATAVGMISILNAVGRICTGTVYDRFGYRVTMLMVMIFFGFSAVMMILAIKTGVFALVVIGFAAGGFAYGGNASISPPMIADFYGRTWYATNFALIPTNALFTSFASVLAGRIYDQTHSYLYPLLLLLGAIVLSAVISLMIRRPGEKSLAGSES
jgi:OFA family oxalate/formate antiporter-like MFS transporter